MATETVLLKIFCENLEHLEEVHGLSGKAMASRLGVTPATYSQLRNGKYSPTLTTVAKVAAAFSVPAELLLTPLERHARVGA